MRKTLVYMPGGWTIDEIEDEGDFFFWIVSPLGTDVCSFPSKERARMYWRQYGRQLMVENVNSGRKLAEQHDLDWDELDEFERRMWTKMANDLAKERDDG